MKNVCIDTLKNLSDSSHNNYQTVIQEDFIMQLSLSF